MLTQPKPYIEKIRLRHQAYGKERRRNLVKTILEKGTPLPKPIEYSDIDNAMYEWLDKKIDISYDGKRLPTYKLYSVQRVSEYMETWNELDDTGNPILNFKTITRDLNPSKGEIYSSYFNIPGHKDYAIFYVPILQENGTEAYDKYTIKQPFGVNFIYKVQIVSNKIEVINKMNELMHYEFSSIYSYISPNEHYMSMTLDDISDNSEYSIDDRKYYAQTYSIKVRGYVIRKEDFSVERIPSRLVLSSSDSDASGVVSLRGSNRKASDVVKFFESSDEDNILFNGSVMNNSTACETIPINPSSRPSDVVDNDDTDECCNKKGDRWKYRRIKVVVSFDSCTDEVLFSIDKDIVIESLETSNVDTFDIYVNDEKMDFSSEIKIFSGDEIKVSVSRNDYNSDASVTLVGYDPNNAYDTEARNETINDEEISEEEIDVE